MINPKDLKEIPLLDIYLDKENEIINQYNEVEANIKRKIEELQNELDNLKFDLYNKMNIKDIFEII